MKIYNDFEAIGSIKNPVLTIGTFDGVHLGHQKIIDQLNREAEKIGGESVLFTFYPHPRMVIYPDSHGLKLLQTQEEKLNKLERMGLKNVILFPFTFEFSRLTALEFVRDYLVNKLHVRKMVIGYDHQFGKNREGSLRFLQEICEIYDFEVIEIPAHDIDDVNISSTKIRESILVGNVERAAEFLGEPFSLNGEVVRGESLGRTIGFPTANIKVKNTEKLVPSNGVYAVTVSFDNRSYLGMMNVGVRPTVSGENDLSLEVNILDFDEDLYNKTLYVNFHARLRDEQRFDGVEELVEQLKKDEKTVRAFFATCVL
ncbi:MAG: bifunctional riboflavin kinase/FAD synthetase [Flavobacteriia bacterium]